MDNFETVTLIHELAVSNMRQKVRLLVSSITISVIASLICMYGSAVQDGVLRIISIVAATLNVYMVFCETFKVIELRSNIKEVEAKFEMVKKMWEESDRDIAVEVFVGKREC